MDEYLKSRSDFFKRAYNFTNFMKESVYDLPLVTARACIDTAVWFL